MIIFTNHSLLKAKQRNISKILIKNTLIYPYHRISGYSDRMIAYKKFDKLYLKVIYRIESKNIIVITQHWEKKPKFIK